MLRQNKTYWFVEILFFLKFFFIVSIVYHPQPLNLIFSHQVVASVILKSQNIKYQFFKKTEGDKVTYFIQQNKFTRNLASEQKMQWIKKTVYLFANSPSKLTKIKSIEVTEQQFLQYFQTIKTLIWTLKYKNPNFELTKCKKTIAKLQLDKKTHLDICTARPLGLAKLSPLLKQLQSLVATL